MIRPEEIFKKIGFILNDLQDQHDYLSHHPEKLNLPELQLFQANADFLSDHVKIYLRIYQDQLLHEAENNLVSSSGSEPVPPLEEPIIIEQSLTLEVQNDETEIDTPADELEQIEEPVIHKVERDAPKLEFLINRDEDSSNTFEFERDQHEPIFDRTLSEEESDILNKAKDKINAVANEFKSDPIAENITSVETESSSVVEEEGPEPFLVQEEQEENVVISNIVEDIKPPVVANVVEDKKPSINELLASASGIRTPSLAPIADLKQAINLNDKLLFIRDLFNGYNLAYAEAIDLLNKMPDYESANAFLQKTYALKNGWADKEVTVARFYELLNRRFPRN